MGRKNKLPALLPSISPTLEPDYRDFRRVRLPPISNGPLVSTAQGRPGESVRRVRPGESVRRVRPGTGIYHISPPHHGAHLPQPPTPRGRESYLNSDGQLPYLNNGEIARRHPISSQIDLALPDISEQLPRTNLRLLRRQQMSRASYVGSETNFHRSPPNLDGLHPPQDFPNLTVQGQRIYTPFVRSPCDGMEEPASDFTSEAISMGDTDSPEFSSLPHLCHSEVPRLNLGNSPRRTPPRIFTPRDLPELTADDTSSPNPSTIPRLPPVKKRKRRVVKDDQL